MASCIRDSVSLHTGSSQWIRYFQDNAAEPGLPWDSEYRLSGAERMAVVASIRQFQLGENAGGSRLLRRAEAWARASGDAQYLQALRLFIREEQRHSRVLGRFLAQHGVACLRRHWVHFAFRRIRALAGLELCMRVLATAEMIALPYYTALRAATGSPLLRAICSRILDEEAAHLRFQAFTFRCLEGRRGPFLRVLVRMVHRWFVLGTLVLAWKEHQAVFLAGGYSFRQACRESLAGYRKVVGATPAIP